MKSGNYSQDLKKSWPNVGNSFYSLSLRYFKSLRHYLTRDVLPAESNYRNLLSLGRQNSQDVSRKFSRPTLDELHDENGEVMQSLLAKAKIAPKVNFSFWFLIWCYFFPEVLVLLLSHFQVIDESLSHCQVIGKWVNIQSYMSHHWDIGESCLLVWPNF